MGASWLILKTEGALQLKAIGWAARLVPMVGGIALISLATPLISPTVFARWFSMPELIALLPIPLSTSAALLLWLRWLLVQPEHRAPGLPAASAGYRWRSWWRCSCSASSAWPTASTPTWSSTS